MAKETLYIDADEEITSVIDKVTSCKEKVVAVVLPKRATLFQSTVNLKLLKKAAKQSKKSLVLITSDPALNAVAAAAGVHIAKSLSSKPAIPKKKTPEVATTIDSKDLEFSDGDTKPVVNEEKEAVSETTSDDEPIELDNTTSIDEKDKKSANTDKKKPKFKIPDFRSFKVRMAIGIALLILLVTGWVFGFVILPKATITIEADTRRVDVGSEFIVDVDQEALDLETKTIPATLVEATKQDSATVQATGEKDVGDRATGTLTLTNCRVDSVGVTIPAGTGFSAEGKTYSLDTSVELGPAITIGGECRSSEFPDLISPSPVQNVSVTANEPGDSYNISSQSFQSPTSGVSAFGSDMTGGTSEVITVISSEDIENAENQLSGAATADALNELRTQLEQDDKYPLNETVEESDATTRNSGSVDDEAAEVTVTRTVTFSMLGIERSDLSAVLDSTVEGVIADDTQNVRDNGLDGAQIQLVSADSRNVQTLRLRTVATIGQVFDPVAITQEVVGKTRGEIENMLEAREGVRSVRVDYEPLWVTTTPKSAEKITIVINEVE